MPKSQIQTELNIILIAQAQKKQEIQIPSSNQEKDPDETICDICLDECSKGYKKKPLKCEHNFCHECYINYLTERIEKNEVRYIFLLFSRC